MLNSKNKSLIVKCSVINIILSLELNKNNLKKIELG